MNIIVPMAGAGSRFEKAGYTFPKPLIEVKGQPMIAKVVENLNLQGRYIFLVQKTHYDKYDLKNLLNLIAPGCEIVQIEGLTEGAACTVLKARDLIDNDTPLIISNSDQFIKWNSFETISSFNNADGGILTFKSVHPKHSFAKVDGDGFVTEVAEKNPISSDATVGIYHWKKGSNFVKYADQMIEKNIRTNNEFYVCPVYNEAFKDGLKVKASLVDEMWGMGTPEELNNFLTHYKS
jgi:NDP-sugar pyrophosphorylase family protein|tara:strand:+ start:286 stop:993 length:708 start_codon:yes stop_codon:yes gene_type:complete